MRFWQAVRGAIWDSDIVLLILDARMPELSRNKDIENIVVKREKELIFVFNKIDIVSQKYLDFIKSRYNGFFVSASRNIGINELKRDLLILGKKKGLNDIKVAVVGYPNVGKSAVINALAKRASAKVSPHAGTTRGLQWIKAGSLYVLDSPGVIPFEDDEIKLGILGSKDPENLKDMEKVALEIINIFINYDESLLEARYGESVTKSEDILSEIAKRKGLLLKGGLVDEKRAAMMVIKDWQNGKLRL